MQALTTSNRRLGATAGHLSCSDAASADADAGLRALSSKYRAVLAVVGISTDFVIDEAGPPLIARFPGVMMRSTKMPMAAEEICAETYEKSYDAGRSRARLNRSSGPLG